MLTAATPTVHQARAINRDYQLEHGPGRVDVFADPARAALVAGEV